MIVFGNENLLPILLSSGEKYFVLNLFNAVDLGKRLTALFPPNEVFQVAPYDSDQFMDVYQAYVENNPEAFKDFLEIMMAYYYNADVIVLTDFKSPVIYPMVETIIKIIQKRYGYQASIASNIEDLVRCKESDMTEQGNYIFLRDKEWFIHETVDPNKVLETSEEAAGELSDRYI